MDPSQLISLSITKKDSGEKWNSAFHITTDLVRKLLTTLQDQLTVEVTVAKKIGKPLRQTNFSDWKKLPGLGETIQFWIVRPLSINRYSGDLSKTAKIWLSKSIFYVKNYRNLSKFFFSLKNIILGACFLLLTFFENFNF